MYNTHYHTHRLFYARSFKDNAPGWYFETKGGQAQGPYQDREDAELALAVYVKTRRHTAAQPGTPAQAGSHRQATRPTTHAHTRNRAAVTAAKTQKH